jgi:molecular chaperone HscB
LKDPIKRAAYLCELQGAPVRAESNTAMPAGFLMQQLEWREGLDEAQGVAEVEAIADKVRAHRLAALERVQQTLDVACDYAAAAEQVRALMFIERFGDDIDRRLEALGQ